MGRCLIVLDLDNKLLEENYQDASWRSGYSDIQGVLKRHCFQNIQGTVYLSDRGVSQARWTLALQDVAVRFAWFEKCVANVQFYDLADDFNAQFIIDGVTQARQAFERRIDVLRQQLIDAGLPMEKVNEIVGKQQFSLESVSQAEVPRLD